MTIIWGQSIEVKFDGPLPLENWETPSRAAVYAIMIRPDSINRPNTFQIIYFGESENLSERGFFRNHHKFNCWLKNAQSESNIFIGIHLMPDSTKEERREIEQNLINDYKPACNE